MNLLSLIFEKEDPKKNDPKETPTSMPAEVNTPAKIVEAAHASPKPAINPKIYDALKEAVAPAGGEAIEKFYGTINSLATAIVDEKARYQTALAISGSYGVTKEMLKSFFDEKISLLEKENLTFAQEQEGCSAAIQQKTANYEEMGAKISSLQNEILELSNQRLELKKDIDQEVLTVSFLREQFEATFGLFKNDLMAEKAKLE
jgi:hypothetical protein